MFGTTLAHHEGYREYIRDAFKRTDFRGIVYVEWSMGLMQRPWEAAEHYVHTKARRPPFDARKQFCE